MQDFYGSELKQNLDRGHRRKSYSKIITTAAKEFASLKGFDKSFSRCLQSSVKLADYSPDAFVAYLECARRHWRGCHELCYAWSLHEVVEADAAKVLADAAVNGQPVQQVPGTRLDGVPPNMDPKEFTFKVFDGLSPAAHKVVDAVLERVVQERQEFVHNGHTCAVEAIHGSLPPRESTARSRLTCLPPPSL